MWLVSAKTRKNIFIDQDNIHGIFTTYVSKNFKRVTVELLELIELSQYKEFNTIRSAAEYIKIKLNYSKKWIHQPENMKLFGFTDEDVLEWKNNQSSKLNNHKSSKSASELELYHRENSSVCVEYWVKRGYSIEDAKVQISNKQGIVSKKKDKQVRRECSPRTTDYWLKRGYSVEDAKEQVSLIQKKNSPRSILYWMAKGCSEDDAKVEVSKHQVAKFDDYVFDRKDNHLCVEFWMDRYGMSDEEAQHVISKNQTRDLEYFIDKYGEEEGIKKRQKKIEKWLKSYVKTNWSVVSQELYLAILNEYGHHSDLWYATKDQNNIPKLEVKNAEYIVKTPTTAYRLDFVDLRTKKVIEFDGEYWHGKNGNKTREELRDKELQDLGYTVLHIPEMEYRKDKPGTVQKCLNFLTKD